MNTPLPPLPWKPVLTFLYLITMLAWIIRLFVRAWAWGVLLVGASYGLFRVG